MSIDANAITLGILGDSGVHSPITVPSEKTVSDAMTDILYLITKLPKKTTLSEIKSLSERLTHFINTVEAAYPADTELPWNVDNTFKAVHFLKHHFDLLLDAETYGITLPSKIVLPKRLHQVAQELNQRGDVELTVVRKLSDNGAQGPVNLIQNGDETIVEKNGTKIEQLSFMVFSSSYFITPHFFLPQHESERDGIFMEEAAMTLYDAENVENLDQHILHIALAIKEMHRLGVAHRDIKSMNVLIDKLGNARLTDFDTVKAIDALTPCKENLPSGTASWIAPEVMEAKVGPGETPFPVTQAIDVWNLGTLIFEKLTEHEGDIYQERVDLAPCLITLMFKGFKQNHLESQLSERALEVSDPTGTLQSIMLDCLNVDPAMRPTIDTIIDRLTAITPLETAI